MTEQEKAALVEWLQKEIALIQSAQDEIPFGLDYDGENTLKVFNIALAALTAESVGDFYEDGKDNWWQIGPHDKVPHVTPLYTTQPAPAITGVSVVMLKADRK